MNQSIMLTVAKPAASVRRSAPPIPAFPIAGKRRGWMTQPKAWKQLSRKVHKNIAAFAGIAN